MDNINVKELINNIGALAEVSAIVLKQYQDKGFTREESMTIVITVVKSLLSTEPKK